MLFMTDELLELTVSEQKERLENLSEDELEQLREDESRQTAIENIDQELSSRQAQEDEEAKPAPEPEPADDSQEPSDNEGEVVGGSQEADERSELERKVNYLIEKCKTTSQKDFEEYDN